MIFTNWKNELYEKPNESRELNARQKVCVGIVCNTHEISDTQMELEGELLLITHNNIGKMEIGLCL